MRAASSASALKSRAKPVVDTAAPGLHLSENDIARLMRQRNIGVSAHIDSGKTTLTERILFYTGRIRDIHEVRGRDAVGAKMDSMELEREKGITIQSAATFCDWNATVPTTGEIEKYAINIIDTPGHVDFTIEVERALRVLDGAVLVLCAVSGVQSQTITVDRQMRRYNVPRISFINKMDRAGANPTRVINQIRQKLKMPAAAVQVPIGIESDFKGVVDLVRWKALYNEGVKGIDVVESDEIPEDVLELAKAKRQELIEALADVDDAIGDLYLAEEEVTTPDLVSAIRRATISLKFSPVFLGSAIKNTGVQPMLDGVCAYLPNPREASVNALDLDKPDPESSPVQLIPAAEAPLVGLAFKLEEGRYGQLTYMRVYQGSLKRGAIIYNARTGKKLKVPRLVKMHSNDMEDVNEIGPGEICAIFGVECSSGDTFTDGSTNYSMTSMFVPEPVISLSIKPSGLETPNFSRALNRFQKEDPTFRTIISGMGELHLDIYVERMRREYGVTCITGKPRTGGAGQFGRVTGFIEPIDLETEDQGATEGQGDGEGAAAKIQATDSIFENEVTGGNIPAGFIPACEKGFRDALEKGLLSGHPVTGCRFVLSDGAAHAVDSSELAFRLAAFGAFREAYNKAQPVILEPIMAVEVVAPVEFQGAVIGGINQRRGTIVDTEVRDDEFTVTAEVALNDMFGYSTQLRGMTQGKGEFTMEYLKHVPCMPNVQMDMQKAYQKILEKK
ncbi:hypothetical protein BS47DRAFT_1406237 [Hydnum rufescens UP504]|uniref:Elongation factor G, mitochondrial n=1 Tax=Hydnum rufescens UP504 TaxID=1448309 RepID=A0A9P6DTR6_9AGAM|nr:hypothetical protein BS47DRAFT_1406237 [Hydnum rufescens UP504]